MAREVDRHVPVAARTLPDGGRGAGQAVLPCDRDPRCGAVPLHERASSRPQGTEEPVVPRRARPGWRHGRRAAHGRRHDHPGRRPRRTRPARSHRAGAGRRATVHPSVAAPTQCGLVRRDRPGLVPARTAHRPWHAHIRVGGDDEVRFSRSVGVDVCACTCGGAEGDAGARASRGVGARASVRVHGGAGERFGTLVDGSARGSRSAGARAGVGRTRARSVARAAPRPARRGPRVRPTGPSVAGRSPRRRPRRRPRGGRDGATVRHGHLRRCRRGPSAGGGAARRRPAQHPGTGDPERRRRRTGDRRAGRGHAGRSRPRRVPRPCRRVRPDVGALGRAGRRRLPRPDAPAAPPGAGGAARVGAHVGHRAVRRGRPR
jgi:hypothetical protein